MGNNWRFGIAVIGSSILLIMSPWIHKSPYSKVRTELNLNCVWIHKLTGLANNCRLAFTDALPLSLSVILIWSQTDFCGCNREKNRTDNFICYQIKAYGSAATSLLWKVQTPKQVKKKIKHETCWVVNCSLSVSCSHDELTVLLP